MYIHIIETIEKMGFSHEVYHHDPILNYEDADRIGAQFNWYGTESKNLILKDNKGKYYVYVTFSGEQFNKKYVKSIIGEKLSLCSRDETLVTTGCIPGCIPPFGFGHEVIYLVDQKLLEKKSLIFSPAVPEITIIITIEDYKKILSTLTNEIWYI
ncbi:MAG: YbaK/EbsC family protein [Clostridia bacterium]|nr:YbaK/EbsC family protein [Clostridia bacterium]